MYRMFDFGERWSMNIGLWVLFRKKLRCLGGIVVKFKI